MLSLFSPGEVTRELAKRAKARRLREGLTQEVLAERSGVSFGSVKRFERTGEISLRHLVQIAFALGAQDDLAGLFPTIPYNSVDEILASRNTRNRARRK